MPDTFDGAVWSAACRHAGGLIQLFEAEGPAHWDSEGPEFKADVATLLVFAILTEAAELRVPAESSASPEWTFRDLDTVSVPNVYVRRLDPPTLTEAVESMQSIGPVDRSAHGAAAFARIVDTATDASRIGDWDRLIKAAKRVVMINVMASGASAMEGLTLGNRRAVWDSPHVHNPNLVN